MFTGDAYLANAFIGGVMLVALGCALPYIVHVLCRIISLLTPTGVTAVFIILKSVVLLVAHYPQIVRDLRNPPPEDEPQADKSKVTPPGKGAR